MLTKNAFAENKLKFVKMTKYVDDWIEHIEGKRENAHYHHFLTFPQCFQKLSLFSVQFSCLFGKELKQQTLVRITLLFF